MIDNKSSNEDLSFAKSPYIEVNEPDATLSALSAFIDAQSDVIVAQSDDLDAQSQTLEVQFTDFVKNFVIPTDSSLTECEVQATRDTSYLDYDFFIYYLNGPDCTGEEIEVKFKETKKYWAINTLAYLCDKTTQTFSSSRGWKIYKLSTEEDSSVVAFAVKKKLANNFKSYSHGSTTITMAPAE